MNGGQPPQLPPSPAMGALQALRQAPQDDSDAEQMPMGTDKNTKEIFIDRTLFNKFKAKKGDRVIIEGTVTTTGISVGITPDSVEPDKSDKDAEDDDKDMDEDLDDDAPDDVDTTDSESPK